MRVAARVGFAGRPREAVLDDDRLPLAATAMERIDHSLHSLPRSARRDEAIRPPTDPFGGRLGDRRADQPRLLLGSRVSACVFDGNPAVVCYGLSPPQRAHDLHALLET